MFPGVETKSNISFAGLSITIWFATKTTLVLSPIAETKAGGAVCADAAVAAAITPKLNKSKNRCFINLSLGIFLLFQLFCDWTPRGAGPERVHRPRTHLCWPNPGRQIATPPATSIRCALTQ